MKELVFHRLFLPAVDHHGDREGYVDGDRRLTWAEQGERVLRLVHGVRSQLGVQPEDRLGLLASNGLPYMEVCHAAGLGAGVVNLLNHRLAAKELRFILEDSETSVVFVDEAHRALLEEATSGSSPVKHVVTLDGAGDDDAIGYEELVAAGDAVVPPEPDESSLLALAYTSGTTALPKGVMIDQRNVALNVHHMELVYPVDETATFMFMMPMFHAGNLYLSYGIPTNGARCVFNTGFDPTSFLATARAERFTHCFIAPTMLAMLLRHPGFAPSQLESLTDLLYGASPMPGPLLSEVREQLPWIRLYQGYGMTEATTIASCLTPRDHDAGGPRLRSAGRSVRGVLMDIRDGTGTPVARGTVGEVWVSGGNLAQGYWRRPEDTASAFRDGWYRTGDAGWMDDQGYVFLVDRVKDMIVSGAENVSSVEVENALLSHPAVAQAAVIGIPHEQWGEQVHAVVVRTPGAVVTADELREHARGEIARYKVPKSVEFREELPVSAAGKILKREIRAPYWANADRLVN